MSETTCDCPTIPHGDDCRLVREQARTSESARRAIRALEARALGLARWRGAADAIGWYVAERLRRTSPPSSRLDPSGGGGYDSHRSAIVERQYAAVVDAIHAAELDDRERNPERPAPLVEWLAVHYARDTDRRPIGRTCAWIAEWAADPDWCWTEREVAARIGRAWRVVRGRLAAGGWLAGREGANA